MKPEPVIFIDDDCVSRPFEFLRRPVIQIGHLEQRMSEAGNGRRHQPFIGVNFIRIVWTLRTVVPVFPRAIGEIQHADGGNDCVTQVSPVGLIRSIPENHAGMVPIVADVLLVLSKEFVFAPRLGAHRLSVIPHWKFILEKQSSLVGHIEPMLRGRADADTKSVPMHFLWNFHEELAHPGIIPGQLA